VLIGDTGPPVQFMLKPGMSRFFCVGRHYCRRSRNWMTLKFWRDIHHLSVTVSLLAQKSPGQSLIPPFQDSWYPTTIASLGVCPNETTPPMHRQLWTPSSPQLPALPTSERRVDIPLTLEREEVTHLSQQDIACLPLYYSSTILPLTFRHP
jgi:hypothetical protein